MEAVKIDTNMEAELARKGEMMVREAQGITITCQDDYERGSAILKDIKTRAKQVKDYWKGPKAAAQAAHKEIVAKEAQMLKLLQDAESLIKKAMQDYNADIERKRREAEEAARQAREAEMKRLEANAALARQQGDDDTADILMDMAEEVPIRLTATEAAPTAQGVSVRKTWKARVTDEKLVPAYHEGCELRQINMSALNALARWSKGKAQIPGVEFYEASTMSVRT